MPPTVFLRKAATLSSYDLGREQRRQAGRVVVVTDDFAQRFRRERIATATFYVHWNAMYSG